MSDSMQCVTGVLERVGCLAQRADNLAPGSFIGRLCLLMDLGQKGVHISVIKWKLG